MMLGWGAAASAIEGLFGLISPKPTRSAGTGHEQPNLFAFQADATTGETGPYAAPSAGSHAKLSSETMAALLAAQGQSGMTFTPMSRGEAMKDLFSRIDADGDGKITRSEFEDALGAGGTNLEQADSVFGKLDRDGDGSVSLGEMASALMRGHRRHRHAGEQSGDALQALDGVTGVTNADGSTTTSLTDSDGSTVTTTKSAAAGASSAYNYLEQLIRRPASAIATRSNSSFSVSI